MYVQDVLGVKVNISGLNSRADADSKSSYTHGSRYFSMSLITIYKNMYVQDVPGVKVNISGLNSRADAESKSHMHVDLIRNVSGVDFFLNYIK